MKAEGLRPDAYHSPEIENDDGEGDDVEHCLCGEVILSLGPPKGIDSDCLADYSDDEKISQFQRVVSYDGIL